MAPALIVLSVLCLGLFGYWYRNFPPMTQFQRQRVFGVACICGALALANLCFALTSTNPHIWWGGCTRMARAFGVC